MRLRIASASCTIALLVCAPAWAGNLDSFPLGNEAAMTGGAVIASTHDVAATWYNPAGLAAITRTSLDGSGSAIAYRSASFPQAIHIRVPGGGTNGDGHDTSLMSVPASLVIAKQIAPGLAGGIGIFTQRQDEVNASTSPTLSGTTMSGAPYAYKMSYGVVQSAATYYAGGALGYKLRENLRVGAGIFAVYTRIGSFFDFGSTLDVGGATSTGVLERKGTIEIFGARATAGVQWVPGGDWEIGAVLRSPVVALAGSQRITGIDQATVPGQTPTLTLSDRDLTPSSVQVAEPVRVHAGFAKHFPKGWIGMSVDYQFSQNNSDGTPLFTDVWNAQVGGRGWVLPWLGVGGGLFTDRSNIPVQSSRGTEIDRVDHIGSARINYYGGMFGVEYRRRYAQKDEKDSDPGMAKPKNTGLEFSTTIALRYALGRGTVQGARIEPLNAGPIDYQPISTDTTIHELNLHIGSAVYF
jgi:long-subunit fatty acid transport protein